jgi:hypothetical protein
MSDGIRDTVNAFMAHGFDAPVAHAPDGPLSGLSFAVKDMYDVAGLKTGFGNPAMAGKGGAGGRQQLQYRQAARCRRALRRQDAMRRTDLLADGRECALSAADQSGGAGTA